MNKQDKYTRIGKWVDSHYNDETNAIGWQTVANCWGSEEYDDHGYAKMSIAAIKADIREFVSTYSGYYDDIAATAF